MCSELAAARRRRAGGRPGAALAAGLLALALPLAGCGKKGDPLPPLRPVPARTEGFSVRQRGLELILELPYPKVTAAGVALPSLDRVELYEVTRVAPPEYREPPAGVGEGDPEAATAGSAETEAGEESAAAAEESAEESVEDDGEPVDGEPVDSEPDDPEPDDPEPDDPEPDDPEPDAAGPDAAGPDEGSGAPAAAPAGPPPAPAALDLRQFTAAAQLRLALSGPELSGAIVGDRIVVAVPLPRDFAEVPQAHWFAVRTVVGEDDRSELSNQASIVPRPPPAPVGGLAAEARPDGVLLSWQGDGPQVESYDVYRREAASRDFGAALGFAPAGTPSFLDTTARFGARYIYAVTAVARRAPIVESAIAEVREVDYRDRFAPPAPQGLVALTEEGLVRLAWEGVRADDLAGYRVLRAAGDAGPEGLDFETLTPEPIQAAEYVDRAVTAGTTYTWRVVAVDHSGNVSESAEAGATAR